jgi:hypothetical protein
MGDLRTELFTKVVPKMNQTQHQSLDNLTFDDGPQGPEVIVEEGDARRNVSKLIWTYIKAYPGVNSTQVGTALSLNHNDISTRMTQLFRREWLSRTVDKDGKYVYSVCHDTYPAISPSVAMQRAQAARKQAIAERKANPPKSIKLTKKAHAPAEPAASSRTQTVDLNSMSVLEARALYNQLKEIFGG